MTRRLLLSGVLALAVLLLPGGSALAASTWYVDGVNGSDTNDCKTPQTACTTIGHAISLASAGDAINVAAATYAENLTIPISLAILGAGAGSTIIDGGQVNTVVTIPGATSNVILSGVTIRNGLAGPLSGGGGILTNGTLTLVASTVSGSDSHLGAGILNNGTLTIRNSTVSGNGTSEFGGGIANSSGSRLIVGNSTVSGNVAGGISNGGVMTIVSSTVSGNTGGGGGISNGGTLTIRNSTVSGNGTSVLGGGIFTYGGRLLIVSSTISGNLGGGIATGGTSPAYLQDTIVANSPSGGNCSTFLPSAPIVSLGHNLSSDGTCHFSGPGDLNNVDPKLGPLQNNGGPTPTQALLAGSPAIDAGDPSGCKDANGALLMRDQRGFPRPDAEDAGVGCDIGAFELQGD